MSAGAGNPVVTRQCRSNLRASALVVGICLAWLRGAAAADDDITTAVEHFLAGRYGAMYETLAPLARTDNVDALRLLLTLQRSSHPAKSHFTDRAAWRGYVTATGSAVPLGTGWERRLGDLGDDYVGHFLHGGETRERRLAAMRFFAGRGEWLHAFEIAISTLHLTGGPVADEGFAAIADAGLHDAAAAGLRARLSAVFQSPDPDFTVPERLASVADFAKARWDRHAIGIIAGLTDLMAGVGGPAALASLSEFTEVDLETVAAVARSDPSRWRRRLAVSRDGPESADLAGARASQWWRRALARGRWLKSDFEQTCTRLCPGNRRQCDSALTGGVVPRGWVCLNPHAALIPAARYRGSVAETDCLKKVFAESSGTPTMRDGEPISLDQRFAEAQRRARCLP